METLDIVLLSMGIVIIITVVIMAVKIPQPTVFQFWVFRVLLSLGAADLGSIIPGFINFTGNIGEIAIRAGGAIALFLVVYLINPPSKVVASLKSKK